MSEYSKQFEQQLWDMCLSRAESFGDEMVGFTESPIETAFAAAFIVTVQLNRRAPLIFYGPKVESRFPHPHFYFRTQAQIGRHRVDFIAGSSWGEHEAIVECDGREFHHSTREQIERDRERDKELEAADYKVFRFPGTQIHNAPFDCATDVLRWLLEANGHEL